MRVTGRGISWRTSALMPRVSACATGGRGYKTQKDAKAAYDAYMADFSKTAVKVNSTMSFGEFFRTYWVPDYKGSNP